MASTTPAAFSAGASKADSESSIVNTAILRRETFDPLNKNRKIPKVWKECNLLSLDGGGIRGIWSLLALEALMECIQQEERKHCKERERTKHSSFDPEDFPPYVSTGPFLNKGPDNEHGQEHATWKASRKYLPCHYFDMICGASTGALIAIMLGRLRMSVADCLHEYETLAGNVFGNPNFFNEASWFLVPYHRHIPYLRQTKYDSEILKSVFKDVVNRHEQQSESINDEPQMHSERRGLCGTCVIALKTKRDKVGNISEEICISSYDRTKKAKENHSNYSESVVEHNITWPIWRVARAVTAAPFYFEPVRSERNSKVEYTDGGLGESNNPTQKAVTEIRKIHGQTSVGVVVSVGTARGETRTKIRMKRQVKEIIGNASDPEKAHKWAMDNLDRDSYFRLNNPFDLKLELDDCRPRGLSTKLRKNAKPGSRTLEQIRSNFYNWYGRSPGVQANFQRCAEQLVLRRKARTEDKTKWEHFATGIQFKCLGDDCNNEPAFIDRDDFMAHIREQHASDDLYQGKDSEVNIQRSSNSWRYQGNRRASQQ